MTTASHRRRHVEASARARRRALAVFLALALVHAGGTAPANAHSGSAPIPILTDGVAGPYAVEVWVDPEVAETTFWIMLRDVATPADQLAVSLTLAPSDGHAGPRTVPAVWEPTSSASGQHRYEVITVLDAPGDWSVDVKIDGPDGSGQAATTFEALPEGPTGYEGWQATVPFVLLGLMLVGGFVVTRRRAGGAG